jgi:membrane-associated PAP2 superfamily phosphatase
MIKQFGVGAAKAKGIWIMVWFAVALLGWDASGLDLTVVRWFADANGFALRDAWLTSTVLHQGGRWLAWLVFAALVWNVWFPLVTGPSVAERRRCLIAALAGLLLVPLIKQFSHSSCPWDLSEFGGVATYVSHWNFGVSDGGPGRCFPSGHAVAAFAFFPLYFLLKPYGAARARWCLAAVCTAGLFFGLAQLARGAHYPSHTLWSAWLCWVISAVTDAASTRASKASPVGQASALTN